MTTAGPRRTRSLDAYRWHTRVAAIFALAALVGALVSDLVSPSFWGRHVLLTGLAASRLVVVLSVAFIDEPSRFRGD